MMEPRKYQEEVLRALRETRKNGANSALVVMATGLGKTVVSAFDVKQYMYHNRGRALFLCHNNGILEQNMLMFQYILDGEFTYGLFNGLTKAPEADFVFASFQTMLDHREEFGPNTFSYIVVDEAHHAPAKSFQKVIKYFRPDFLLGMTATPERLDGLSLEDIFGPITYNLGLVEAMKRGLLVDIDYHLVLDEMADLDSVVVEGEKISMNELNRRLFIPKRDEKIATIIQNRLSECPGSNTLIFCRSIEHAEKMSELLVDAGVVHSGISTEQRRDTLDRFRMGELQIIISVDQLNEGIDLPHADVVVFLRSTVSQVVFYQQLGRGLRLHDGKEKVTVLDFVGNYERLGVIAKLQDELNMPSKDITNETEDFDKEHFVLNIEASQFTDHEVNILSILERIDRLTWGWSADELITQVQMLAKELGRTPGRREFDKDPRTASGGAAENAFGSWNKFLEAAGLEVNVVRNYYSADELITQVQMLAKELGRTPGLREFNKDPRTASVSAAVNTFDSWNKFLEAAGLEVNKINYSADELITQVQMLAKELGKMPSSTEFDKDPRTASRQVARRTFGSWNKFLEAAGLEVNKRISPSK